MKRIWQRLRLKAIAFREGVRMLRQLLLANRQRFGGRWFVVEEVLVTLASVYNIRTNEDGWIRAVFIAAYREQHGRLAAESEKGGRRVDDDIRDFEEKGELPFYVMRRRMECVAVSLIEQEE